MLVPPDAQNMPSRHSVPLAVTVAILAQGTNKGDAPVAARLLLLFVLQAGPSACHPCETGCDCSGTPAVTVAILAQGTNKGDAPVAARFFISRGFESPLWHFVGPALWGSIESPDHASGRPILSPTAILC